MPIIDKLKEIDERIQAFAVEEYYEPKDMIRVLNIMADLVGEVRRIDAGSPVPDQKMPPESWSTRPNAPAQRPPAKDV
jgi:hypothetical protein